MCLGDDILNYSRTGIATNRDLHDLYATSVKPDNSIHPKVVLFNKEIFSTEPPFKKPYITYQFDRALTQRTWCPETIFTNRQLYAIHEFYSKKFKIELIDVGHRKWSLHDSANIIFHATHHMGLDSGMGWLAVACGKSPDIWYATDTNCKFTVPYRSLWLRHNASIHYFDQCFSMEPCSIAVDGLKYKHKDL